METRPSPIPFLFLLLAGLLFACTSRPADSTTGADSSQRVRQDSVAPAPVAEAESGETSTLPAEEDVFTGPFAIVRDVEIDPRSSRKTKILSGARWEGEFALYFNGVDSVFGHAIGSDMETYYLVGTYEKVRLPGSTQFVIHGRETITVEGSGMQEKVLAGDTLKMAIDGEDVHASGMERNGGDYFASALFERLTDADFTETSNAVKTMLKNAHAFFTSDGQPQ